MFKEVFMTARKKDLLQRYREMQQKMKREVIHRKTLEKKLEKSERHHNRLMKEARSMQEHLRHLSRQILLTQEEERKEISRELHDEIAQTLSGINVHMAALKVEDAINTKSLRKKISSTQRLVEKSVKIVHRFARDLRPAILDDLGLIPALHSYMKGFTKRTRIPIRFKASLGVEKLNFIKRTMFYRVVQAALTNVAQHAHATLVKVTIQKTPRTIHLKIADNGKSFQVEHVLYSKKKRLGLLGMRERVEMVGGRFSIESVKGMGTTIGAEVPIS
jgi:signal transduction histidine kinase